MLSAIWLLATAPLCGAVFLYFRNQLSSDWLRKQVDQEKVLAQVFERNARFGDIVNAKSGIEALGNSFGLQKLMVCQDGAEVIGALIPVLCDPTKRTYEVHAAGTVLSLQFQWSENDNFNEPLLIRAVIGTATVSLIVFTLITWIIYNFLLTKIESLSWRISRSEIASTADIEVEIPELLPIASAITELKKRIQASQDQIASLRASEAVANLARQVAHDIRSPLSALQIFAAKAELPPDLSPLVVAFPI